MRKNLLKDERAVSAVIATVIIVAVTIAVAIAVAYWMGGLATVFTRFEKIEVKSAYVTKSAGDPSATPPVPSTYTVTLSFVNTGATSTSIDQILLNGVPFYDWGPGTPVLGIDSTDPVLDIGLTPLATAGGTVSCPTGVDLSGTITFSADPGSPETDPSGNQLRPGVTLTITLHSSYGKDYHASVTLP